MDGHYGYAKVEGVMEVLQQLSDKEGFTVYPSKKYVIDKLTELELTDYIEPIINNYYKMTKEELTRKIALLIANKGGDWGDVLFNVKYSEDDPKVKAKISLAEEILDLVQDYLNTNDLLVS